VGAGSTATVFLLDNIRKKLIYAYAGDCKLVVGRKGQAMELALEHKVTDREESLRIQKAGNIIKNDRVYNKKLTIGLNLTRAIGDFDFKSNPDLPETKQAVTADPVIGEYQLDKDCDFILVATDGLWADTPS
jgi:serine/threonine protein phosphatase PrpC